MKVAIVFNGQGAHFKEMGLDFSANFQQARSIFERTEEITKYPIREWIKRDIHKFKKSKYSQIAIAATSVSIFNSIKEYINKIEWMAGLSLGEYSALIANESIDFNSGIKLLKFRGEIMSRHCKQIESAGLMAVIGLSLTTLQKFILENHLDERVYIANVNSSNQIVIGGLEKNLNKFKLKMKNQLKHVKCILLSVEGPFHTPLMSDIIEEFADYLKNVNFKQGVYPVISNLNLMPHKVTTIKEMLVNHLIYSTFLSDTVEKMYRQGMTHLIQVGPGNTLIKFISKEEKRFKYMCVNKVEDIEKLIEFLHEENINE